MIGEGGVDFANLTGVGVGAILLTLVFRTLWRQEGGWRAVLDSSREDAAAARADAAAARADAAQARTDASTARADAGEARRAERVCQRRMAELEVQISELRATGAANTARLDHIGGRRAGEAPNLDDPDDLTSAG